jgi:hypothetical protein
MVYLNEEAMLRWDHARRRRPRSQSLSEPCHEGGADDLLTMTEAARILGYHGPATIRSYISRFPDYFPEPDQLRPLPNGRMKKLWRRAQIWEFAERRR